jgi:hypothetical protein
MIQRSEGLCFALEARHAFGIARKLFGQNLERDLAIQIRVARPIHFAHPTRTERRLDVIRSYSNSRKKLHQPEYAPVRIIDALKNHGIQGETRCSSSKTRP